MASASNTLFSSSHLLPPEIYRLIFDYLTTVGIFRIALASSRWKSIALPCVRFIAFGSISYDDLNPFFRWTKLLDPTFTLSGLISLQLNGRLNSGVLLRLLSHAPGLQTLQLFLTPTSGGLFDPQVKPELSSLLRQHQGLRSVMISKFIDASPVSTFLPRDLTELRLQNCRLAIDDVALGNIVLACQNLAVLELSGPPIQLEHLRSLKPLKHLASLFITSKVVNLPSYTAPEELQATIELLRDILPSPPNNRWNALSLSEFRLASYYRSQQTRIPVLREIFKFGVEPTLDDLYFDYTTGQFLFAPLNSELLSSHLTPSSSVDEVNQLEFVRFVLEECQLSPQPCRCFGEHYCDRCRWIHTALSLRPRPARYLIERHFLPFVKAKATLLGRSPGAIASSALSGFDFYPLRQESVLEYINNYEWPLDVGAVRRRLPMFCNLAPPEWRQALLRRAKATSSSLNLATQLSENDFTGLSEPVLREVCEMSEAFALLNLSQLLARSRGGKVMNYFYPDKALSDSQRLEYLKQAVGLFATTSPPPTPWWSRSPTSPLTVTSPDLLIGTLSKLLTQESLKSLVNHTILREETPASMLQWLAGHEYNFNHLRSPSGENWLHIQLPKLLTQPTMRAAIHQPLLAETDARGETPLHRLVRSWHNFLEMATALENLLPFFEFIDTKALWNLANAAGKKPFDNRPTIPIEALRLKPLAPPIVALIRRYMLPA